MKKTTQNILIGMALCFALTSADAQYVTIPDTNFRNWLNTHGFASCMNGSQMDTTCSAVVNATSISCNNSGVVNLTGIQYFDNLQYLNCRSNSNCFSPGPLNYIPALPSTLLTLDCSASKITSLPALPSNLQTLNVDCNHNLNSLLGLPWSLKFLSSNGNPQLAFSGSLNYTLPPALTDLYLIDDNLTSLPTFLPSTLKHLECYNFSFPTLTSIPSIPSSLIYLDCNNSLLTSLPALPSSMSSLNISNSPGLKCLPSINSISYFYWSSTGITCLPNAITVSGSANPTLAGVPICSTPTVTASGSTAIQQGDSVKLNAYVATGWTYQWKLNTVNIPGATSSSFWAKTAGNYTCIVTNNCSTGTSNAISITVVNPYVTIPDANFVAWLNANGYASCMSGNQMDTTCSTVVNATTVLCDNSFINDLTGISYFDNLFQLTCTHNGLSSLPRLPATLQYLWCTHNQLTSVPSLPKGLRVIGFDENMLTSLPALPDSLRALWVNNNQLTSLPVLPSKLSQLYCQFNQLTLLPALPSSLDYHLDCSWNQLTSLPTLPSVLTRLYCYNNQLTSLPALSSSLRELYCNNNPLGSLPALPDSLQTLYCAFNNLSVLPALPATLANIYCLNNQLTALPALPDSLNNLFIYNNPNILCLPSIRIIGAFNWSNTSITCLPNGVNINSSNPSVAGVPICPAPSAPTSISVTGGSAKVCPGDTRIYTTPLVTGVTYNWTVPTGAVINSGQGTRTINVSYNSGFTANGVISVVKVQGCGVSAPKTINIIRNVPSTPSAITGTTYGLCGANNKTFSVTQVAGMTYQWTVPTVASIVNGQGTNSITVNFPSTNFTGTVSVKAVNACGAGNARNLTVRAVPSIPVSITGPLTACANQQNVAYSTAAVATATSYNWTVPSGAVVTSGQGTNSMVMKFGTASGNVKVSAVNACGYYGSRSVAVVINCKEGLTETDNEEQTISVYPNPTNGQFNITSSINIDELKISDVLGQVVYRAKPDDKNVVVQLERDGLYFVSVTMGEQHVTRKLVVQH